MEKYSLKDVNRVYSSCSMSPVNYKIGSYVTFLGKENFLRKKAVNNLDLVLDDKVLDLACGMGYNFDYLRNKIGSDGIIFGVDYIQGMLNAAKKRIGKKGWHNVRLIKKDAAKLNFPENYFDGIISTIGISSIPNHKEALKRSITSLKHGKRIVILDGKLFNGFYKIFNPLLGFTRWSASWDKNKDIIADAKKLLKDVVIEEYLGGSFFIITGVKKR
tara:strand:+ start:550 stop:1200 length:651 start_codon:yes stop_codon:yes gene_type:complete